MDATIIIPSYKSDKTIDKCLRSLLNQNTKFDYEVILVDSSPDDRVDSIVAKFPIAKFIKLENKTYAGTARNIGAEIARGELLLFVDADIIAPDEWIENVIKYYKTGHDVFACAVDVWGYKANILAKLEWFFEFSEFKPTMREDTKWCLPTTALAVKKIIFHSEKFTNMERSQDVEFTVRLCIKKYILHFNPKLKIFHIPHMNLGQLFWKAFHDGLSNVKIRQKYGISGSYFIRVPILCFFAIPGFALVKLTKISWRNLKYNNLFDKLLYILLFPLIVVLIFSWMTGYYKELFRNSKAI